jgi:uncharacterized protein
MMMNHPLTLQVSERELAICRLPSGSALPEWIEDSDFVSITRTPDELSIVCDEQCVPGHVTAERHWHLLKVKGPLEFSLTGIMASLVMPLSAAGIPIFALSTYETDYLLVKSEQFDHALEILRDSCAIEKDNTLPYG